jgi:tetratricopeptide (TPR) repeat protein
MDNHSIPPPQGEEIIAPIRVRRSEPVSESNLRRPSRRMAAVAVLLLLAGLAAGGIWWIGYLSRRPLEVPAGPQQAEAPAAPALQAFSQPQPQPTPAETAPPTPPSSTAVRDAAGSEAVEQRIASGQRWAAAGNLAAALNEFQEAFRLNPQSQPALAGLQRVKARMAEEEFRRWMAEGFAALNRGDAAGAQARFLKAKALRPEAAEVKEALAQAEVELRSARIEALRQKALSAEQNEDWSGAFSAYAETLTLEPTLQFAQQGKERSAALTALERRIAFFMDQPDVLESDAQLANAERLLRDIQAAPPAGARLSAAAQKLSSMVQTAKTPVRVIIESDHRTHVAVYRVGKLGLFGLRELSLRPGAYTVVGSRDGYRDERLELVVKPGPEPIRVTVVCHVKI